MKGIAGRPLSAIVAYSRKRKNQESSMPTKKNIKIKKQRVKLSEILPSNETAQSTEDFSSSHKSFSSKHQRPKTKLKKRLKTSLTNGGAQSSAAGVTLRLKKRPKLKSSKIHDVNKRQRDSSYSQMNEGHLALSDSDDSLPRYSQESTQSESKKKKDKSSVENIFASPSTKRVKPSSQESKEKSRQKRENISKSFYDNPYEEAKSLFQWLIHPMSMDEFFQSSWEKAPIQVRRKKPGYYKMLMSSPMLDGILRNFHVVYTKNIDITSYSNGQRETHNPPGRALPSVVWDYYSNGCSIRMLNPQTYIAKLHALNSTLQEFFGCFVGANSYLTPPDSQGFAPHYDDIEAFILQVEGKKRWRLYKSANEQDFLPRYSSKNFEQTELGELLIDTVVEAGDLLYFPRGTIHQGETIEGTHSLHITLSVYQKNSWCDFLEKLLPRALKNAVANDSKFREGLPLHYANNVGYVHSSRPNNKARQEFIEKSKELVRRLINHLDVDSIVDQMVKSHSHDFLPPVLLPRELACSVLKDGEKMRVAGRVENRVEIEPDTRIRLVRAHCIRLVEEEDCMKIYFSTENSKEYHEFEPQMLEVSRELAPAVQEIIRRYPDFVKVDDLPIDGEDSKIQVVRDLWEKCIVVTDVPLPIIE